MEKCNDLPAQQQLAVSMYLKTMSKTQAAKDAGYETTSVFNNPAVKAAINEQLKIRAERLRIGADFVLSEAVKVYHRCMQIELVTVLDNDGLPEGRYQFDARGAIQALTLVGKHVDVKAFGVPLDTRTDDEVMARLLRGRQRRRDEADLLIDSDDVIDEQPVSFL